MQMFLNALILGYSGAMMPGPLLTYTMERSLSRGWKVGLLVPLGHVLMELLFVALLYLGLGSLLNNPLPKMIILFAGGIVLFWFGLDMIRSAVKGTLAVAPIGHSDNEKAVNLGIMMKAGLLSVLNPYFLLWWATIGLGTMLAKPDTGVWGAALFYSGHAAADITWYLAVSLLCGTIGSFMKGNVFRVIIALLGGGLGYFAVKFIIDGIILAKSII